MEKSDKLQTRKNRFPTVDYFHRTPSVYSKAQAKKYPISHPPRLKNFSYTTEDFYKNPILLLIKEDIIEKPKKPLMRRKSCCCSKCGKQTSLEQKIMAINAISHIHIKQNEIELKKCLSSNESLGVPNRFRGRTIESKSSKLFFLMNYNTFF